MDCAPYCHPTVGSNQGFIINFGILCNSSEAGRLESCGLPRLAPTHRCYPLAAKLSGSSLPVIWLGSFASSR